MNRTHTIRNATLNPRQLFVEIVEAGAILTSGTFDTKDAAYAFIDSWGARRCRRITLDPMSASRSQLGLVR